MPILDRNDIYRVLWRCPACGEAGEEFHTTAAGNLILDALVEFGCEECGSALRVRASGFISARTIALIVDAIPDSEEAADADR
ncbi:MAG: hypothetical protein ABFD89_04715 [Bryobacteraceae bacterium]